MEEALMNQYAIFDFETSGLNSKYAEVIEISAIKIVDNLVIKEFDTLVKPTNRIDSYSTAVNGITDDMVLNAPSLENALSEFLNFIEDSTLLGYNIASFDMPILRRIALNTLKREISNEVIDILHIARKRLPSLPDYKLSTVATHFNISIDGAHRALADCYIAKDCYEKLQICPQPNNVSKKERVHKQKPTFTEQTKALQTLQGFLLGIIADDILTESEVIALKNWLDENSNLAGQYPFDRVFSVIDRALEDGVLEQCELDEMLVLFKKFTSPVDDKFSEDICDIDAVDLKNKLICLTGDFNYGSRKDIEFLIEQAGGLCRSAVSGKTDYVIVGNLGSPDWSCGNYGSKIKKALELQAQGSSIQILKEDDFIDILKVQGIITDTDKTNNIFFEKLQELLDKIILSQKLPEKSVHIYSNKSVKGENVGIETSKSICIYEPEYPLIKDDINNLGRNFVIMNIQQNDEIELLVRHSQFNTISLPTNARIKPMPSDTAFMHIIFKEGDDSIYEYIKDNILYCLRHYHSKAKTFGCCSKFNECSNAMECIHENKLYATACIYRKNLDNGKIFYGENRNIDSF